eukprot:Ihof_evm25s2 gene=Ihof_evmTU25s2
MSKDSDEEYNYMSDVFLEDVSINKNKGHKRDASGYRGLLTTTERRKARIEQRKVIADKATAVKAKHVLEKEAREEGMAKPLPSNNKGFTMLQRMGYKPGMGLGKEGKGLCDPLTVEVLPVRIGLGRHEEKQRELTEAVERELVEQKKRMEHGKELQRDYRLRMAEERKRKEMIIALRQSLLVCEELDRQKGISNELWEQPEENDEEKEEVEKEEDQLAAE